MCLVKAMENVAARVGSSRKLRYKRKQQVVTGLLLEIPEIEVKVRYDGRSDVKSSHNIMNNGGTGEE